MSPIAFALVISGVLLNAVAQLCLKAGTNAVGHFEFHLDNIVPVGLKILFQPYILGGLTCYAVSLVVWILALSRVPVSIAYPMLSIGYVVNAAVAHYWLGEVLETQRMIGIGVIIVGVALVAKS